MEQMNKDLLSNQKDNKEAGLMDQYKGESGQFRKVRENYGYFAAISGIFGIMYAGFFYKADIGFNVLGFACVMIGLLYMVSKKLNLPIKKETWACYLGVFLLGGTCVWSASGTIWFFSMVGMLLLLNLSLVYQFHEIKDWGIFRNLRQIGELSILCLLMAGEPFKLGAQYLKTTNMVKDEKGRNILIGILISVPLLFVVIGLLSSADMLFGSVTQDIYDAIFSSDLFYIILVVFFASLFCFCIIFGAAYRAFEQDTVTDGRKSAASILTTVLILLCMVYILFCGIQVMYLFAGGLFVLPQSFTYAEYARQGFFELLAVTVINILLMVIANTKFEENRVTRVLLTLLTVCTYCMIGSAGYRMLLYIGVYNLTFLRLAVLLFLVMDSLVLAGMIVAVFRKNVPIFKYCVVVVTICYLVFAYARPDALIATYHVSSEAELSTEDFIYLAETLSEDAAVVVQSLADDPKYSYLAGQYVSLHDVRGFNVANYKAYQLYEQPVH